MVLQQSGAGKRCPDPSATTSNAVPLDWEGQGREGAETRRTLHRARLRMQRFSAMYTLLEGRQGRGENTPPPLYKLRQSPKLIRSLRLL